VGGLRLAASDNATVSSPRATGACLAPVHSGFWPALSVVVAGTVSVEVVGMVGSSCWGEGFIDTRFVSTRVPAHHPMAGHTRGVMAVGERGRDRYGAFC
jgi:hypothetical protein